MLEEDPVFNVCPENNAPEVDEQSLFAQTNPIILTFVIGVFVVVKSPLEFIVPYLIKLGSLTTAVANPAKNTNVKSINIIFFILLCSWGPPVPPEDDDPPPTPEFPGSVPP